MDKCKENRIEEDRIESFVSDIVSSQVRLGMEMFKLMTRGVSSLGALKMPGSSGCDIPDPCWMPVSLGEIQCRLRPGETGGIYLHVRNEDFRARPYHFQSAGPHAARVAISPASVNLGPKETATVRVGFSVPAGMAVGDELEALVWVRGCRDYYLRWNITVVCESSRCCYDIPVIDKPDYVHHWYDHFYTQRRCFGTGQHTGKG